MKLLELFDTRAKWEVDVHGPSLTEYHVELNGKHYIIQFSLQSNHGIKQLNIEGSVWLIEFSVATGPGGKNPYGITGTGNAPQILALTLEAMKDFVSRHHVDYFVFSAVEPSRQRLYKRMIARLGQHVGTLHANDSEQYVVKV